MNENRDDELIRRGDAYNAIHDCAIRDAGPPSTITFIEAYGNLRSIPAAHPAPVVTVTAEECGGVEFQVGEGVIRIVDMQGGWCLLCEDEKELICFENTKVADLLNGALARGEKVTFPEGHRLNPKPEPPTLRTLEVVVNEYLALEDFDTPKGCELEQEMRELLNVRAFAHLFKEKNR